MSPPSPLPVPTAVDLLQAPVVLAALAQAWADSLPNDPMLRHEEGGWIYWDTTNGQISVRRAPAGARASLPLGNPPMVNGSIIVGTFHTHPNPTAQGWNPGPSAQDSAAAAFTGVPWLIRADNGDYSTGPPSRRGGAAGGPGYPP